MLHSVKKGAFTLIELLVVITIIGILATGATTVYTSQIQKARDTTRQSDITALRSSIEQFYQDASVYPQGGQNWINTTGTSVMDYAPTLAEDPKHNQTCNGSRCGYVYSVGADSNGIVQGSYEISTAFENEGNRTTKAAQSADNGEDDNRLEIGLLKTGATGNDLNTQQAQATAFNGTDLAATDTSATIVIVRSGLEQK